MSGFQVLRFEGSRLRTAADVTPAVHEIYRALRRRRRVVVLISSTAGATRGHRPAALLADALAEAGVPHDVTNARDLDAANGAPGRLPGEVSALVVADSPALDADPASAADTGAVPPRPVRIILLGLGTVGLGVYRHLSARPELFDVRQVVVRDLARHREDGVPPDRLSTKLWTAINEPAEVVIELIGGLEPAADVVHAALLRGRTVISANKALVAERWSSFERYARRSPPRLRFSAAVGGALPVLETIDHLRRTSAIVRVRAVINGTCNFVLDELAGGRAFEHAVRLAQQRGFAEADPRADLSGTDAAQKLCLIARAAFGVALAPDTVERSGIEHLTPEALAQAEARGARVRLVASCEVADGAPRASVRAETLDSSDYLAGARHEENRVELTTASGDTVRLSGKGAGRWPTALSVMGDVYDDLASRAEGPFSLTDRSACPS